MSLPRRLRPTLAHGVQLLLDRSDAMLPFLRDVASLEEEISQLVGAGTEVLHFVACPTRGCGRGGRRRWKPYGSERLPRPGTRVLCVTDLGIGMPPPGDAPALLEEWAEFIGRVRRAGGAVAALVPYPSERWPHGLEPAMQVFEWDWTLTMVRAARGMSRRR
ncbi:hypothetical protein [Corallococcus exiguus]|uniref:hypothetical protein n=1 Tax=Corallococcus exiguus TaxID=83462 RepID=UPI003DA5FBA0